MLASVKLVASVLAVITVSVRSVAVVSLESRSVVVSVAASVWRVRILVLARLVEFVLVGIIVTVPHADVRSYHEWTKL